MVSVPPLFFFLYRGKIFSDKFCGRLNCVVIQVYRKINKCYASSSQYCLRKDSKFTTLKACLSTGIAFVYIRAWHEDVVKWRRFGQK